MSGFSYTNITQMGIEGLNNALGYLYPGGVESVSAGEMIVESKSVRNLFLLGAGEHQGFMVEKPQGALFGAPGVVITRLATIRADTIIDNLYFRQDDDPSNINQLVVVESGTVMFRNCVFQRRADAPCLVPTDCFVLVRAGASVLITGSLFRSDADTGSMVAAVGTVVQNLNPVAGDVEIGANVNRTGQAYGPTVNHYNPEL